MKPVYQTRFGEPDGNCLAACIASIFEIDIDEVPDFGIHSSWWSEFGDWCVTRFGLQPVDLEHGDGSIYTIYIPKGYYIVNGMGPRGLMHCVISKGGKIVHDPHPEGGGLEKSTSITIFAKVFE